MDVRDEPADVHMEDLFGLEEIDADLFRGSCHEGAPLRAFGGQVAAQALNAAVGTVPPGLHVHSLHGYFLRPGDSRRPIVYSVERLRDGRTYHARRVTARQRGEAIFTLATSFKEAEEGPRRHGAMPNVPPPEELPNPFEASTAGGPSLSRSRPWRAAISLRYVPGDPATEPGVLEQMVWMRSLQPLGDDPHLHVCALTYGSDLGLARTAALDRITPAMMRDGRTGVFMASLDHAMWFHGPFRADEWVLFAQRSPFAGDGRGISSGEFWTRDGRLVASAVQEVVIRDAP